MIMAGDKEIKEQKIAEAISKIDTAKSEATKLDINARNWVALKAMILMS